jgi:sarcosine oxidase
MAGISASHFKMNFDVVVVGLGSMGSFACMELARRGASVAGFDRFEPPHGFGSHSGETRIYREAYAENPDYVPLVRLAGRLWDRYGEEDGSPLLTRCGLLSMGSPDSEIIDGVRRSAALHHVPVQMLSANEVRTQFPAFDPPDGHVAIFDSAAGWVDVDRALSFNLRQASLAGATTRLNSAVERWSVKNGLIQILAGGETFHARTLVLTAGAWSHQFLSDLPLSLERRVLIWLQPPDPEVFQPGRMPVFMFEEQTFYGFPYREGRGVKVATHTLSGDPVADPSKVRPPGAADCRPVVDLAAKYLPKLGNSIRDAKTCLYTMTPDCHFIIDRHPEYENVYFAAGFSGHGFKFAPAIGQALADLALDGRTEVPVEFLRLRVV